MKRVITTAFALAIYSSISFGQTDTTYLEGLKGLGNHKGGKKDGHWILFYLTNQKQSEGVYKSGLPEGHWIYTPSESPVAGRRDSDTLSESRSPGLSCLGVNCYL